MTVLGRLSYGSNAICFINSAYNLRTRARVQSMNIAFKLLSNEMKNFPFITANHDQLSSAYSTDLYLTTIRHIR